MKKFLSAHVFDYAASAAFYAALSFVPFMMLLMMVVNLSPGSSGKFAREITALLPEELAASGFVSGLLTETAVKATAPLISITTLTLLFSAARCAHAVERGIARIHLQCRGEEKPTPQLTLILKNKAAAPHARSPKPLEQAVTAVLKKLRHMLGVLGFAALIALSAAALFPVTPVKFVRPLLFFLFFLYVIKGVWGALFCTAGWILFSVCYTSFFSRFLNYSSVYGSFAGVAMFLLWLYFCMVTIFIGTFIELSIEKNY